MDVAPVRVSPDVTYCPIENKRRLVTRVAVGRISSKSDWERVPKSTSFRIPLPLNNVTCSGDSPASATANVLIFLRDRLYI